jgi:hypothetical protein
VIQKKLDKVSGYLYKIEFDYNIQKYHVVIALPAHWVFLVQTDVQATRLDGNDISVFYKLYSPNIDNVFDNLLKIIKHNDKADQLEHKLKAKLADKKQKLHAEEFQLANSIKRLQEAVRKDLTSEIMKEPKKSTHEPVISTGNTTTVKFDSYEVTERLVGQSTTVEQDTE